MYGMVGNYKKLKETYDATLQVKSAIPHPRIMGVIRECGGRMHMAESECGEAERGGGAGLGCMLTACSAQKTGKQHRLTSSRPFSTTMKPAVRSGSRCSSISC